jgi:hypothetical protein
MSYNDCVFIDEFAELLLYILKCFGNIIQGLLDDTTVRCVVVKHLILWFDKSIIDYFIV